MTTEYQSTREEEAYGRLLEETEGLLSEAARTVLATAQSAAYADCLVRGYFFQPEEYDDAKAEMSFAAVRLTDRDSELLARLWRSALGAAASIDPYDKTPAAGHRVVRGDAHRYYRMLSHMVEGILQEKKLEELRKAPTERKPVISVDDIPL